MSFSLRTDSAPHDGTHHAGAVGLLADRLFRHESAKLRGVLLRKLGAARLDLADDIVQETLLAALQHWRFRGVPSNPAAWLMRVAQHKAVDVARREKRHAAALPALQAWAVAREVSAGKTAAINDPVRLMLLCAHPLLSEQDRVMLTLSLAGGFGHSELARAFLLSPAAAEQRLVRAKRTLREAQADVDLADEDVAQRMSSVHDTMYLMLNEGYSAHAGDELTRNDLLAEVRYLLQMLLAGSLVPAESRIDTHALAALAAFIWSRRNTRTNADGGLMLLQDQDRARWDKQSVGEGLWHLAQSTKSQHLTTYGVEAAIAACHAAAPTFEATDWTQIVMLYDLLHRMKPTPVVLLNAAAAWAMLHGPEAGLAKLDAISIGNLQGRYHLVEATRGEILRRAGKRAEAAACFRRALQLPCTQPEKELLEARLREVCG